MSIFSKLRASKKAAKDHKAAEKQKEPDTAVVVPYQHLPTHAAVDSLSGAPSSWSRDDGAKIKEQHKRRSAMIMSRASSSLSMIPSMNAVAGPSSQAPPMPRNSSHSSFNPTWFDKIDATSDSKQNRYRPQRCNSSLDSGIGPSPLGSKMQSAAASTVASSGTSTNSNHSGDNLEIAGPSTRRPAPVTNQSSRSNKPQGTVFAEQDIFDRLHTNTKRKLGEAPVYECPPGPRHRASTAAPAVEQKQKTQR